MFSTVIQDTKGEQLRVFLNENEQWYLPPDKKTAIPDKLLTAVTVFEDKHYLIHPGVNILSFLRAFYFNTTNGKIKSGASTISMQVARLMQPKQRSIENKIMEVFQAVKLELLYNKEDIFRLYVENAPYGGNIIGYQSASTRYFGKKPVDLTWGEAAMLAVLPNAPSIISPDLNPLELKNKRDMLLEKLYQKKIISKQTFSLSLEEEIPDSSISFPVIAPHAAVLLNTKSRKGQKIQTTIVKKHQEEIQNIVSDHLRYLHQFGIKNGAAIVVENETGKVRAYVGSQSFYDTRSDGQVDGVQAPRSTGSILKPFLYALSFDEGLILPSSLIKDIPTHFGAFSPSNQMMSYDGLVSAHDALVRSLNVPAVRLLNSYGLYQFYMFLRNAGISTLFRHADDYGLPLIIGGAESSLYDLAALYRGLALYGEFSPLTMVEQEKNKNHEPVKLISSGASYLTLTIMNDLQRPGAEFYWEQYNNQWPLAWKTGTSFGQRDAWAIGVNPEWTIAVWIGNFTGEGNANLKSGECAGPVLFDIFNYLPKDSTKKWFVKPIESLKTIEVCRETGYAATSDCPHVIYKEVPVSAKIIKQCPYHASIYVDEKEEYQVCSRCWEPGKYKKIQILAYSPDVMQYLRENGNIIPSIPIHNPKCTLITDSNPLQIIYPTNGALIWIPRDFDGSLQKVTLRAAHRDKDQILYWYINNVYQGITAENHVLPVSLSKGAHILEIVDTTGSRIKALFEIDLKK